MTLPPTARRTGTPASFTCTTCPLTSRKMVQNSVQQPASTITKSSVCPSLAALAAPTTTGPSGDISVTEVAENGTVWVARAAVRTTSRNLKVVLALPTGTIETGAAGCPGPSMAQVPALAPDGSPAAAGRLAEGGADGPTEGVADWAAEGAADEAADGTAEGAADWAAEGAADWAADGAAEGAAENAAVGSADW